MEMPLNEETSGLLWFAGNRIKYRKTIYRVQKT